MAWKQVMDIGKIELIDAQHVWLLMYEMIGAMCNDRPRDDDAIFAWTSFQSCVKVLAMVDGINSEIFKLILSAKKPSDEDVVRRHSLFELQSICEQILNGIGWPKDIKEYNGT